MTGDGWNEPKDWDFDACSQCCDHKVCPSCSVQLSEDDADAVFSGDALCPFCGWTTDIGEKREREDNCDPADDYFDDPGWERS